jgi:hypothetical protein
LSESGQRLARLKRWSGRPERPTRWRNARWVMRGESGSSSKFDR